MIRPRIAAVASAIAASTVAFVVVSRWHLVGTLAGAVLIPLVYTLVSHWSSHSLDHMAKWLRRRARGRNLDGEPTQPSTEEEALSSPASGDVGRLSSPGTATRSTVPNRGARMTQWLLIGVASLALAVSIYAITSPSPVERVIVHDRVVEKTSIVTTSAEASGAQGSDASSRVTTDTMAAGTVTDSTTVVALNPEQTGQSSSTTVAPATTTTSLPPSSTTTVPATTTTSLPPSSTTTGPPSTATSLP